MPIVFTKDEKSISKLVCTCARVSDGSTIRLPVNANSSLAEVEMPKKGNDDYC